MGRNLQGHHTFLLPQPPPSPKDVCRRNLERHAGPSNVLAILKAADSLNAQEMKQQALGLAALHFHHIARSAELKELPQHLLVELVQVGGRGTGKRAGR